MNCRCDCEGHGCYQDVGVQCTGDNNSGSFGGCQCDCEGHGCRYDEYGEYCERDFNRGFTTINDDGSFNCICNGDRRW